MQAETGPNECRLCHNVTNLCQSHIIPEFCYQDLYDTKHRGHLMQSDMPGIRLVQKGLREPLLCTECETRLSKLEKWFKEFWYGAAGLPGVVNERIIKISVPNMERFHMFHLSILWRAGVATGRAWRIVHLGPYEEKLRAILLGDRGWELGMYPLFPAVVVHDNGQVVSEMVSAPHRAKLGHTWAYYTFYSGVEWRVLITEALSASEQELFNNIYPGGAYVRFLRMPLKESGSVKSFLRKWKRT